MLTVYQPKLLLELKQRDKSKIESVLAYDDRLLVGLSTGSLRIYRITRSNAPGDEVPVESRKDAASDVLDDKETTKTGPDASSGQRSRISIDLLRELEKFSKQRIEQLALFANHGVLIALTNSQVHLYDLKSFDLRETLVKSKGASILAATAQPDIEGQNGGGEARTTDQRSRIAVAVKRRLLVWDWTDGQMSSEPKEMVLASGIKSLTWFTSQSLVAGLGSSYVIVNIDTGNVIDIIGPGSIGGAPGQDGGRFGGAGVAGMGYLGMSAPTPLATRLERKEMLLAKDINTHFINEEGDGLGRRQIPWATAPEAVGYSRPFLLSLQAGRGSLEIRNPKTLTLLQNITSVSASRFHVPRPDVVWAFPDDNFLAFSDRTIWRLESSSADAQVDELVEKGHLEEAISLLEGFRPSRLNDKLARMKELKMLKAQILFDQHKFRDSIDLFTEVYAPPERVIALYPPFISGNISSLSTHHSRETLDATSDTQPSSPRHKRRASSIKSQSEQNRLFRSPGKGILGGLLHGAEDKDASHKLEGKALKMATEELRGFLVSTRTKLKKILNPDGTFKSEGLQDLSKPDFGALLEKSPENDEECDHLLQTARLVDTTLFRAYMFVSPSFAGPLFRIDNFCDPDVVNEKLIEAGRYNDLVDYFNGKKMHKEALDLLKRFGDTDKSLEEAPQLAGPERTVAYLQNLPPDMIDLILQFAEWPLRRNPDLGMEIFLADTENSETLPRQKVLDFLEKIDLNLAVRYLEHIIHELNDTTPAFHQKLVDIYVQRLKSGSFANNEERAEWNAKTLQFLKSSRNYQAYKVLGQLDKDDHNLYEVRAIILSHMGQHKQALEIYVFKLESPEKAEEYCNQTFLRETTSDSNHPSFKRSKALHVGDHDDESPSIYYTLLSLYLSPPHPYKPQWAPALAILARHGARIPASSTLKLVPDSLPVQDLESYFCCRIRAASTVVNEGRITAGLRNVLAVSEEARLRLGDGTIDGNGGRNRRVVISEERVCGVCFKRFGGSAVKVLPE